MNHLGFNWASSNRSYTRFYVALLRRDCDDLIYLDSAFVSLYEMNLSQLNSLKIKIPAKSAIFARSALEVKNNTNLTLLVASVFRLLMRSGRQVKLMKLGLEDILASLINSWQGVRGVAYKFLPVQ